MPATLTEPCTLLFAIVLVLVSCAAMLVSLHAIDAHARHDGGPRRRAADGLTPRGRARDDCRAPPPPPHHRRAHVRAARVGAGGRVLSLKLPAAISRAGARSTSGRTGGVGLYYFISWLFVAHK